MMKIYTYLRSLSIQTVVPKFTSSVSWKPQRFAPNGIGSAEFVTMKISEAFRHLCYVVVQS